MREIVSFGQWLNLRRRALLLTQAELARRVGCSTELIRKIEADARRPSPEVAAHLAEQLALPVADRPLFVQVARAALRVERLPDPLAVTGAAAPPSRRKLPALPLPPTPLVGRTAELSAICARLNQPETRLFTLIGPPGIGKTRLALQAGRTLQPAFRDGAAFVPLVDLREPAFVLPAIAASQGVRERPGQSLLQLLAEALQESELLLILDNCEHVIAALPVVATLLAQLPGLKILATSRAVLRISGESVFPIPPLEVPDPARLPPLAELADYAAITLFTQRARDVRPNFALTSANAPAIAAICARLDGIPLAIELAAARSRLLAPPILLARLSESYAATVRLLNAGPHDRPVHQQTLHGALDWSYQLLPAAEQRLLRQLGVFVGGFTLESVTSILAAPAGAGSQAALPSSNTDPFDLLNQIDALVDQSLVGLHERPDGQIRFVLLETIREYALDRLTAAAEAEETHRRHAQYFLLLAERAEHALEETTQGDWPEHLAAEYGNLRAALTWLLRSDPDAALRLAAALWRFWMQNGLISEGRRWLAQALEAAKDAVTAARAKALRAAGMLAWHQGDFRETQVYGEQLLAVAQALGDVPLTIRALSLLGMRAALQGDYAYAQTCYDASMLHAQSIGYDLGVAVAQQLMGYLAVYQGDCARAVELFTTALEQVRALGNEPRISWILGGIGEAYYYQNDYVQAGAWFTTQLTFARERAPEDQLALAFAHYGLGLVAFAQQNDQAALEQLIESMNLRRANGDQYGVLQCLEALARLASAYGQAAEAGRLLGYAAYRREQLGTPYHPVEQAVIEPTIAQLKAHLGLPTYAALGVAGQALSLEQAVTYAGAVTLRLPQ
jgi:predicted ATPase/transcriptional regulator with XRE-family HTH domain